MFYEKVYLSSLHTWLIQRTALFLIILYWKKKNDNINHFFFLSVDLSKMYLDTFCPREREILSALASGYEMNN